jgi:hydroxymethylglutaryl-CoA lyase
VNPNRDAPAKPDLTLRRAKSMLGKAPMLANLPRRVSIYEVSPRDGLQNESHAVPLEDKKHLIEALLASGLRRIELTSFVSPRWIPQLADADELVRSMKAPPGVVFSALCPNTKGLERAVEVGLSEVAVFLSASETHNLKNTNKSIARSLDVFDELVPHALEAKMRVRGYVSTVWGCPYEGEVDPARALEIGKHLLGLGCYQISLGDTIGVGTPIQTQRIS